MFNDGGVDDIFRGCPVWPEIQTESSRKERSISTSSVSYVLSEYEGDEDDEGVGQTIHEDVE